MKKDRVLEPNICEEEGIIWLVLLKKNGRGFNFGGML